MKKLKEISANISLAVVSILITYLILEFFIFKAFIPHLPLRYKGYLPEAIQLAAQSSKRGLLPHDYIAIVGDSYAKGLGDWLLSSNDWKNGDFASQHIFYKKMGRDVVNFGKCGSGSLAGLATRPISHYQYLQRTSFYKLEKPRTVLVYFYEGNDLNDDLLYLNKILGKGFDASKLYDPDYFQKFLENRVAVNDSLYKSGRSFAWTDNLVFLKFLKAVIVNDAEEIIKKMRGSHPMRTDNEGPKPNKLKFSGEGKTTRALIDGKEVPLPDRLWSPALELRDAEIKLSTYVFKGSLKRFRAFFPDTKIYVVYIPSPLASYRLISEKVDIKTFHGRNSVYNASEVGMKSDLIAGKIREIAEQEGATFIDTRPKIRQTAEKELLHGPRDYGHLNQRGYTVLADAILPYLKEDRGPYS